jgi:pimeloyl-ACP methyl ester carboxylesterase
VSRSQEIRAAGRLVAAGFVAVVDTVRDVHRAVADRWFTVLGPAALPVRVLHDGITSGVYRVVRAGHAAIPAAAGAVAAGAAIGDERPLSANPPAALALAVLNGVWGDTLRQRHPELALAMTVRADGADVPLTPGGLARAYPAATARIAVFVHGLCETEQYWSLSSQRHHGSEHSTHGSRLHHDLGYTPVYLRYNTGLHISENGEQLARLLDDLVAGWPVPVEEVVLIGHSMGGLVVRSACRHGAPVGREWARLVRHVFCLGTPHLGAPLEKGANVGAWLLARFAETQPLSRLANLRSAGIKDLRFGSVAEEDWHDVDPDELLRDRCTDVAFLPHVTCYFIATTVTAEHDHPFGRVVGDLCVRFPSASGQGRRRIPFTLGHGRHVGGLHHFDLLNHPAVYRQIHTWLAHGEVAADQRPSG